jgi:predicted helicase
LHPRLCLGPLKPDDFKTIEAWLNQSPVKPAKKQPRPDQEEAILEINKALVSDDRTSCIEACGTGKTLLALWLTESRRPSRVLVFVTCLALLAQTRREWRHEREIDFNHLCVCSDPTVDGEDEPVTYASECDFPLSTSPEQVRRFLDFETDRPKVVFCTYHSSQVIADAMTPSDVWDLGIFDEAHRTAGRAERSFVLALEDKNKIRITRRVFFTATPRHCNPLQKDATGEAKVLYSMDDTSLYGRQAYRLTFKKAVELDIICRYKVLVPVFTTAEPPLIWRTRKLKVK